jgi:hypothetical protein
MKEGRKEVWKGVRRDRWKERTSCLHAQIGKPKEGKGREGKGRKEGKK